MTQTSKASFILQFSRRPNAQWMGNLETVSTGEVARFNTQERLMAALAKNGIDLICETHGTARCETCGQVLPLQVGGA